MDVTARGIYRELLDECWVEGSLPPDMEGLAEIARCTVEEMTAAWSSLNDSFTIRSDGRLVNDKIVRVLAAQKAAYARRVKAGRIAGLASAKRRLTLNDSSTTVNHKSRSETTLTTTAGTGTLGATPSRLVDLQGAPIPDVNGEVAEPMTDEQKAAWRSALGGSPRAVSPPTGT